MLQHFKTFVLDNRWIEPYKPFPKQAVFLMCPALEVLFGGSAGPGKSYALLMAALMYVDLPGYSALIIRKSYQDLSQPGCLIPISQDWLAGKGARWSLKDFKWTFPSGATLSFGYLADEMSMYKYQGANYHLVAFDELTQHEERRYLYLFSRLRKSKDDLIPLRMRATSNPGGIGHDWVKQRFIESNDPDRIFIPARIDDNLKLDKESYVKNLNYLDPVTREQLLNGDWTAREAGGYFRREWFQIVRDYPKQNTKIVRFWDLAATAPKKGKDPDWTAGVLMAENAGVYYIIDVRRMRGTPQEVEQLVRQTAELDPPSTEIYMEREPGSAGVNVISHYARNILKGFTFREHRTTGEKELRVRPLSSAAEAGNVKILPGPWVGQMLDEMESFPNGSHDDVTDGASGAYLRLSKPAGFIMFRGSG